MPESEASHDRRHRGSEGSRRCHRAVGRWATQPAERVRIGRALVGRGADTAGSRDRTCARGTGAPPAVAGGRDAVGALGFTGDGRARDGGGASCPSSSRAGDPRRRPSVTGRRLSGWSHGTAAVRCLALVASADATESERGGSAEGPALLVPGPTASPSSRRIAPAGGGARGSPSRTRRRCDGEQGRAARRPGQTPPLTRRRGARPRRRPAPGARRARRRAAGPRARAWCGRRRGRPCGRRRGRSRAGRRPPAAAS